MSLIKIKGLTKRFGEITAFEDINLEIKQGEVFGLLGPNGAGKTTLIRTLIGLLRQSEGTAEIFDFDTKDEIMEIRKRTSLLPQECQPYENLTARENILFYGRMHGTMSKDEIERRTEELIDIVGLRGRENDRVKDFSGGMKRKVLVARALVMNPDLIFLDEPTTGVDVLGARTVRNLIKKMAKEMGKTIILTTHDLHEVDELCDRVGIMVNGKLVAIGKPDDLEEQFKKAHLEDVFIGLVTGEGINAS
ncbi:MAG: ABC transporter ATP-binding protein [Candidatus Kariarchaeaceae archaeon]|jgi:ABC-2 type transport system ATP-binding protein